MTQTHAAVTKWTFGACAALALFGASQAQAGPRCPEGSLRSEETCCPVGTEYVPSKHRCTRIRPERRCVKGHLDDCVTAGRELERGDARSATYAAELYRYACEEGYAPACRGLGSLYQRGHGIARDEARARVLYEESCDGGDAPACTTLAKWLLKEGRDGLRAGELLTQACHRGDFTACDLQGQRLSTDPSQHEHSARYLERACTGGVGASCRSLLELEQRERSVAPARERDLLERACEARDATSCTRLGDALRAGTILPRDGAQAALRYRAACEGGHQTACVRLGELTFAGEGVARDPAHALELFRKACRAGEAQACERASAIGVEPERVHGSSAREHAAALREAPTGGQ